MGALMNEPLHSLLPPTATPLMRTLEQVMARMADIPIPFKQLWDPQHLPRAIAPLAGLVIVRGHLAQHVARAYQTRAYCGGH